MEFQYNTATSLQVKETDQMQSGHFHGCQNKYYDYKKGWFDLWSRRSIQCQKCQKESTILELPCGLPMMFYWCQLKSCRDLKDKWHACFFSSNSMGKLLNHLLIYTYQNKTWKLMFFILFLELHVNSKCIKQLELFGYGKTSI